MPVWSSPLTVKVSLESQEGGETRRVVLPAGTATRVDELFGILANRFGKALTRQVLYVDADRDAVTVSSDAELQEALAAGVCSFRATEAGPVAAVADKDDWEIVGARPASPEARRASVDWCTEVRFWVNGEEVVVSNPSPDLRLLDWLREVRGLTGTHVGCNEGGCGICTVSMTRPNPATGELEPVALNSCLRRLCGVDGCHIVTTEGIGCQSSGFHPIQSAIAAGNGSQCGFCTPGWVMNMYALLDKNRTPTRKEVEEHFDGNLCRCTGYRPILTSFGTFAKGGANCGRHQSLRHPAALLQYTAKPLHFANPETGDEWFRPTSMAEFRAIPTQVDAGKAVRLICASTGDGVRKYLKEPGSAEPAKAFVDISYLPELQGVRLDADGLWCGAAVPIGQVISALEDSASQVPSFAVLASHMKRIASTQIRSVASWAGNVMLNREFPNFPSDLTTVLAAIGATFEVAQLAVTSRLSVTELLAVGGSPLLVSMKIPKLPAGAVFQTFKTGQRHVFAHAIVNFGACITFQAGTGTVADARIFLGGACSALTQAAGAAKALVGRSMDDSAFQLALAALKADIAKDPSPDPRRSNGYRQELAATFLYKTFLAAKASLPADLQSSIVPFVTAEARPISSGTETFATDPSESPVSQYIPKRSAFIQASGEAKYPSDYSAPGAVFGQLVISRVAKGKLVALDASQALKMPGVYDFIAAAAVPGLNCVNGSVGGDNLKEKLFFEVNDVVPCIGLALGLIVADTWYHAKEAADQVVQQYADVSPVVANMHDSQRLRNTRHGAAGEGKVAASGRRGARMEHAAGVEFAAAPPQAARDLQTAKGKFSSGGQKHFYMETQSVCAIPHDGDQWEVICSDQDSNFTQANLALVLGVPQHHINVKVPRAGGAFGGKLTRQCFTACAAVVAARKLKRPVRIQNDRVDDMRMVGGREPMDFDYQVTFDSTGRVDSMEMMLTVDPGWFYGDSKGDVAMAVGWSDNCYQYRNFKVDTQVALTDTPMNTSVRAPGCMQSILAAEVIIEHVAKVVGKPTHEVQALNFYNVSESPVTPFGDHIGQAGYNWTIPTLWTQVQDQAKFAERRSAVEAYNAANRWTKKGIAISPAKYVMGIDFYSSGALVCIYGDGTVLVSSGGSEIGQGLSTKVALCAADALGAPLEKVLVGPRETSKVPDNSCTGGSGTSECSCEAAILACETLAGRLKPYRDGGQTWEAAVAAAANDHVSLVAAEWFSFKKTSNANAYATYGAAVSEVTIDVLTGEVQVDRVDVLMDLGTQLDAAVDIGQLQGGFVIAMGHLLTEELQVDASGTQLNLGTWEYKIPSAYDIPLQFNFSLLKDSPNPVGIKGSKASAEPAMCLIPSVYLAVKNAIYAAREQSGAGPGWFMLNTPLTTENIRTAVGVVDSLLKVPA